MGPMRPAHMAVEEQAAGRPLRAAPPGTLQRAVGPARHWLCAARDRLRPGRSGLPYAILSAGLAASLTCCRRCLGRQLREEALRRHDEEEARAIQLATLKGPPPHPDFEIAVRFEPAQAVSGDFYSFFSAGSRLGVIVGDVSGKGIPAALVSTSICHLCRWLRPMQDPEGFLAGMNQTLLEQLPTETYASLAAALVDPETGHVAVYNAGHPPALLLHGGTVSRTHQPNMPLGLFPDVHFISEMLHFERGDMLLLYSDGFIETRDAAGNQLTVDGLASLARQHAGLPPAALAGRLVAAVRAFGPVIDDLTLVVVRRRESAPSPAAPRSESAGRPGTAASARGRLLTRTTLLWSVPIGAASATRLPGRRTGCRSGLRPLALATRRQTAEPPGEGGAPDIGEESSVRCVGVEATGGRETRQPGEFARPRGGARLRGSLPCLKRPARDQSSVCSAAAARSEPAVKLEEGAGWTHINTSSSCT